MAGVRLIAGLGNPGPQYEQTRHNVGVWFVRALADRYHIELRAESRFKGQLGRGSIEGHDVRLLVPSTFMNLSGESVGPVAHFYRIAPAEILVAYDEMAFEPGVVRLKTGGGANGHNGITSVIAGLGNNRSFHRLRIGVGHPGDKDRVSGYLTSTRTPAAEAAAIEQSIDLPGTVLDSLLTGDMGKAMNVLHEPAREGD